MAFSKASTVEGLSRIFSASRAPSVSETRRCAFGLARIAGSLSDAVKWVQELVVNPTGKICLREARGYEGFLYSWGLHFNKGAEPSRVKLIITGK